MTSCYLHCWLLQKMFPSGCARVPGAWQVLSKFPINTLPPSLHCPREHPYLWPCPLGYWNTLLGPIFFGMSLPSTPSPPPSTHQCSDTSLVFRGTFFNFLFSFWKFFLLELILFSNILGKILDDNLKHRDLFLTY